MGRDGTQRGPGERGLAGILDGALGGAVLGLAWGLGALPPPLGDAMGATLGALAYVVDGRHRRRAVDNLLRAGMAPDLASARRLALQVFQNLGRSFADLCRIPRLDAAAMAARVRFQGEEHLRAARAGGRGVLLVTAHLGAWEMLPIVSALRGEPIHVVVRPMDNLTLDRAITSIRTRGGNGIIPKRDLMRGGLKVLKAGGTVGILMDQNITWREGVFVEFFGRPASTAYAPALLAMRAGATVLPVAIFRQGPGRHRIVVESPIALCRTGNLRHDLQENTARFTRAIEALIRRSPTEWFWVHRRWKTQPRDAADAPLPAHGVVPPPPTPHVEAARPRGGGRA